jgi:transcriptional regulator with XRE-family HTH domain
MPRRRTDQQLSLGQQLREARLRAQLDPKELAERAGVSVAAVYNCERIDRGGRVKTLIKLAEALGLRLRIPDLAAIRVERGLKIAKIALISGLAFDTVRSILSRPESANVRTLESVAASLKQPLLLVV